MLCNLSKHNTTYTIQIQTLSLTEPAKIMLIHVADDGAQLVVFH